MELSRSRIYEPSELYEVEMAHVNSLKCDRCGTVKQIKTATDMDGWAAIRVRKYGGAPTNYDYCPTCTQTHIVPPPPPPPQP